MELKRKPISGLKKRKFYSLSERHQIIQAYLTRKSTKRAIWQEYTGFAHEHGQIIRWMRELGYDKKKSTSNFSSLAAQNVAMSKKKNAQYQEEGLFENLQLKKRVAELESKLKDAEMKAIAYSTMIDIAEKELDIVIRKKLNTKPLKR